MYGYVDDVDDVVQQQSLPCVYHHGLVLNSIMCVIINTCVKSLFLYPKAFSVCMGEWVTYFPARFRIC